MDLDDLPYIAMHRCTVPAFINDYDLSHSAILDSNYDDPTISVVSLVVLSENTVL
jgi:hypothetical protein